MVGDTSATAGENHDVDDLDLNGAQLPLLWALTEAASANAKGASVPVVGAWAQTPTSEAAKLAGSGWCVWLPPQTTQLPFVGAKFSGAGKRCWPHRCASVICIRSRADFGLKYAGNHVGSGEGMRTRAHFHTRDSDSHSWSKTSVRSRVYSLDPRFSLRPRLQW